VYIYLMKTLTEISIYKWLKHKSKIHQTKSIEIGISMSKVQKHEEVVT
jgi:hypothetical protein